MGKLDNIKKAIQNAPDNDATRAIKYLLWYIESQNAELKYLHRVADSEVKGSPDKNGANQISYSLRMIDEDQGDVEQHRQILERFKRNV